MRLPEKPAAVSVDFHLLIDRTPANNVLNLPR